jgi:hypothetical protein
MRRGSATALPQASAHYLQQSRLRAGAAELLREDRILKVMIVRNEIAEDTSNGLTLIDPRKVLGHGRQECQVSDE